MTIAMKFVRTIAAIAAIGAFSPTPAALMDTSDDAMLLLDHQSGLFQTVKDVSITDLRNNTSMLA